MQNRTKLTIKYYWQHMKRYPISGLVCFFAVIGAAVTNVITPLYFKKFFDILTIQADKNSLEEGLIAVLLIIAGIEFLNWLFWRVGTFFASYFQAYVNADLANYCFEYLHKHSFGFFNNNFVGSLVKRVNRFYRTFEGTSDRLIFDILPLIVNIVIIVTVLFIKNLFLGIGLLVWIFVFLLFNWFFIRYKLKYDIERSQADTKLSGILADTITNHTNIKLFNGYGREIKNFSKENKNLRRLRFFTWNLMNTFQAVQGLLTIILEIGIFYLAIKLWQKGLVTIGDFVLIQSYILIVFMRIWDFGRTVQHIYEDLAEADEMTEILNTTHEIVDVPRAKELQVKNGEVKFEKMSFNYHQTHSVLKDLNLVVKPKEKIALVGTSGAGKTTITKLLLRLHEVTKGKILVDDQDIAKVTQESLWRSISLVPQDPILFHRSLKENIRYGRPEATDEEVIIASKLAHCHEFISECPEGYDTYVGERGVKLSGGERQRVAIARAILRNAPILILDEATSSLDSESEHLIQDALDTLMKGKTVIVIAHRLSTIMRMDRIVVIDKGGIVEEGTHEKLTKKKGGIYQKLWKIQAGGFIE